jgi:hypothetical protein
MSDADNSLQLILDNILRESSIASKDATSGLTEAQASEIMNLSVAFLEQLKSKIPEKKETDRRIDAQFETIIYETWEKPFDLLNLIISLALEVYGDLASEREGDNYLLAALLRLQANACLVFFQILSLLKKGFPDGAALIWKSLHETTCIAYFISKHGQDVAKNYLDYEVVENYYQAKAIRDYQKEMEYELLSEKDFQVFEKLFDRIEQLHGTDFVKKDNYPYGWVPPNMLKKRSFEEIEKTVGLNMLRPYYDMVSFNALGGPQGLVSKLGPIKKTQTRMSDAVGPSNYGIADPGMNAAISLGQITSCLLKVKPTLKRLIIVETMRNLIEEICAAFNETEKEFSK